MDGPVPANTSGTARLLLGGPTYAVGWQEAKYIPNPAPGASWSYTADGRYYERLIAATFQLTTSAAVANRFPQLFLFDNNGKEITSVPVSGTIVASTTLNVKLQLLAPTYSNGTSGGSFGFIPDILIPPGWQWSLTVFSEDVADQISNVVLLVQRYPNDTAEIPAAG